ncbi:MAG: hypothetical protein ACFFKA_16635 [Candidatus Thorarchaeota archaeon]
MVLIIAKVIFPHTKSSEVAKKNIDLMRKYPLDRSLGKTIVIGIKPTLGGMRVLAVIEPNKGKIEDYMERLVKIYQEFSYIEGYRYELDTYFEVAEAYKVFGMELPPEE